jgi:hypothetical protein
VGATAGQQLRAIADGVDAIGKKAHELETMVMEEAATHPEECECKFCVWADRYPDWLKRLQREHWRKSRAT